MSATTQETTAPGRSYRFGTRQDRGVVMGLNWTQIVALGAGGLLFLVVFFLHLPVLVGLAMIIAAGVFAFAPLRGKKVSDWAEAYLELWYRRYTGAGSFRSGLTYVAADGSTTESPPVPVEYSGITFAATSVRGHEMGLAIRSERGRRILTGTFAVKGLGRFPLLSPGEQDGLVGRWGRVLAQAAGDADAIVNVAVCERALPSDPAEEIAWMNDHLADVDRYMIDDYEQLAQIVAGAAATHEVHVSVSVASGAKEEADALTEAAVLLASFSQRMAEADLSPTALGADDLRAHLAGWFAGVPSRAVEHPFPVAEDEADWSKIRTNDTWHRVYLVRQWPRIEVPATWLDPLLSGQTDGITRSLVVHYRPISHQEAATRAMGDVVGTELDRMQRQKWGFIQTSAHANEQQAAAERESELAQGEAMHMMAGLIVLSSADDEALERSQRWVQAAAGRSRLEVEPAFGQQARALAACLPLGLARVGNGA